LPGKSIRDLAGLPLIGHAVACARLSPVVTRCIVSTDSPEIAEVAAALGADVPFLRPVELARGDTPMAPVLRHALEVVEAGGDEPYEFLLLLDPTSPSRDPDDIGTAVELLSRDPSADGVVTISEPRVNPLFVGVTTTSGYLRRAVPDQSPITRRQDAQRFLQINGALYLWRCGFLRAGVTSWLDEGRHLSLETPDELAHSIDTDTDFRVAEALIQHRIVVLPWLTVPATEPGRS